jgi:flavin-dependent dehydrogenase
MSASGCDVAVIGGSLAGSAAAAALARGGATVIVLEKARFPRPKMCGEFLSHEALPVLERIGAGAALRAAGFERIERFALVRADGVRVDAPLPEPVVSLSRERLDEIVATAARASGALFIFEAPVLSISGNLSGGFRVEGPGADLRARVAIGAWGRYSPLDGKLGRPFFKRKASLIGFKKHFSGDSAGLAGKAVLHLFEGGYLGLSRVEGGIVNLAALATPLVAKEAHGELDELLSKLADKSPVLRADLRGLVPLPGPVLLSEPVHLGFHGTAAGDVLLVGDAAGVLDPFTGTGMSTALLTGEAAAAPVLEFLAGRLDAKRLVESHDAAYRSMVGGRFFFSRLFRPFFCGRFASRLLVPAAAPAARLAARLTR